MILQKSSSFLILYGLAPLVLLHALSGEDFGIDNDALDAMEDPKRRVPDITRLFAKYRPEELLLRRELGLPFWGHLTDQNVPGSHLGTDPNDPALVQIL